MTETREISLHEIQIVDRVRQDFRHIADLARSMQARGLLHAIVLDSQYRLIAGERRIRAAQALGWTHIRAFISDAYDEIEQGLLAEREENTERQDLTPSEMVALARRLLPYEQQAAHVRQQAAGARGGEGGRGKTKTETLRETFPRGFHDSQRSAARTAIAVGTSRPTLAKAEAVVKAAEADPAQADLVAQMDRTGKVG